MALNLRSFVSKELNMGRITKAAPEQVALLPDRQQLGLNSGGRAAAVSQSPPHTKAPEESFPSSKTPVHNIRQRSITLSTADTPEEETWQIDHARVRFEDNDRDVLANFKEGTGIEEARQAKIMRVSGSATLSKEFSTLGSNAQKVARVKLLHSIVTIMEDQWQMETPSLIINVTGNVRKTVVNLQMHACEFGLPHAGAAVRDAATLQRDLL
eukprot:SAG11_NODE_5720_length_1480_cov_1.913831_2_plen_212_part_00